MINSNIRRNIAERYHRALPDDIRDVIKRRGIPATIIEKNLLGWNGKRVTIPVFGPEREVLGFRYATVSTDPELRPEVVSDLYLGTELYGWETLLRTPPRVVICDGEFDRLVLEGNGFPAVTSTGPAGAFLEEWMLHFAGVRHIYVCFSRDGAGTVAAKRVQEMLPRASIVTLPPEVGGHGTVTDFFVGLGRGAIDFEVLLAAAAVTQHDPSDRPLDIQVIQPADRSVRSRAERVRRDVRLHDVVAASIDLQAIGGKLVGRCPFHNDHGRSLAIYPAKDVYRCEVCGVEGEVVSFVMNKESMTCGQALEALERFEITHELYGAA